MTDYTYAVSKPRYLCRWWLRTRLICKPEKGCAMHELYIPLWAKPLDFIWGLFFGKPRLYQERL